MNSIGVRRRMNSLTEWPLEYKKFWNDARKSKAKALRPHSNRSEHLGFNSVEKETLVREEKPRVAGLYLNRIRRGIKLQADPTVIYALGDFTVNRVLREHLKIDNPYNTYMYKGLPPGSDMHSRAFFHRCCIESREAQLHFHVCESRFFRLSQLCNKPSRTQQKCPSISARLERAKDFQVVQLIKDEEQPQLCILVQ